MRTWFREMLARLLILTFDASPFNMAETLFIYTGMSLFTTERL